MTAADPALTDRQWQVLHSKALGRPNKAIAADLGINEHTVKFHASSAYERLGVTCLVDALRAVGWLCVPQDGAMRH